MRKIIISIILTACVALCAAVWPRSAEVGGLPAGAVKPAVTAEIETETEKTSPLVISAENYASEPETVTEIELIKQTALATTNIPEASPSIKPSPKQTSPSEPTTTEPKAGSKTVIDGKPYLWFPGFGWVEDEGGGSIGTTVGNPGDQLTGHKVGIMD